MAVGGGSIPEVAGNRVAGWMDLFCEMLLQNERGGLLTWLGEANRQQLLPLVELVRGLDPGRYASAPPGLEMCRIGAHVRHVVEFYECLLEGLDSGYVDYDSRRRDLLVERSPNEAVARMERVMEQMKRVSADRLLMVRPEGAGPSGLGQPVGWMESSAARELQAVCSHTVHHLALIGIAARAQGLAVPAAFGMAPSTLAYERERAGRASAA